MPTYDYRCDGCGHEFDAFQSIMDPAMRKCPKCKKQKLRRLIGAGAGIIFKGSGFYETDYKRSRAPDKSGPEKSGEKDSGKGSEKSGEKAAEGSSDKKPEKKSEKSEGKKSRDKS